MTMLYLIAIAIFALSLYGVVEMHEQHSWERKACRGDRAKLAKLLARQRADRRLFAKVILLGPVKIVDFFGGLAKDLIMEGFGFDMSCARPGIFHASCYAVLRSRR